MKTLKINFLIFIFTDILFGIGISSTYTTITSGSSTSINVDKTLFVSVFGLLIGLCSALIYLPYNGYQMTRAWGYYLISIYVICMITNIIIELTCADTVL